MKTLLFAFKIDGATVFREDLYLEDVFCICGRWAYNKDVEHKRLVPFLSFVIASFSFFINKLYRFIFGFLSGNIFTLIDRNRLSEILIKKVILKHRFEKVIIHWCGYGFLPLESLARLRNDSDILKLGTVFEVVHHDWGHFTGGCHVPSDCNHWHTQCDKCMYSKRGANRSFSFRKKIFFSTELNHRFVSSFQLEKLAGLNLLPPRYLTVSNRNVEQVRFIDPRPIQNRKVVVFIGVIHGNGDNKGVNATKAILNSSVINDCITIGINCTDDLSFSISFNKMRNEKLLQLLNMVDFVVVPSKLETFSMVSFEGIVSGCTVLCRGGLAPTYWGSPSVRSSVLDDDDSFASFVIGIISGP